MAYPISTANIFEINDLIHFTCTKVVRTGTLTRADLAQLPSCLQIITRSYRMFGLGAGKSGKNVNDDRTSV